MSLDPDLEEMRRLGYLAVDRAVSHLANLSARRVATPPVAAELRALVEEPLPRSGHGLEDCIERFFRDLLPRATLVNHPRFFAYIPGPGSFAGAVGEWLAASTNTFVGSWLGGAVMAQLELQTLQWLRESIGLPEEFDHGILTSGGSMANLIGLAAARTRCAHPEKATVYISEEAHYSAAKAARILGVPTERVRLVPCTDALVMDVDRLRSMIEADRADGLHPSAVVATAGTTNVGAIDPLPAIADLCTAHDLWLHVDAAYGAAVCLLPEERHLLVGWERADSITLDPHKWFYSPFECGCALTRHGEILERTFDADGTYLQDIPRDEVNFFSRGPELTRGNRALKLWMHLRTHGVEELALYVRRDIELTHLAAQLLDEDPRIRIATPPSMSMFSFAVDGGEAAGQKLFADLLADGHAMLSTSRVRGEFVLRFCVVNHRTTEGDIRSSVAKVRELL